MGYVHSCWRPRGLFTLYTHSYHLESCNVAAATSYSIGPWLLSFPPESPGSSVTLVSPSISGYFFHVQLLYHKGDKNNNILMHLSNVAPFHEFHLPTWRLIVQNGTLVAKWQLFCLVPERRAGKEEYPTPHSNTVYQVTCCDEPLVWWRLTLYLKEQGTLYPKSKGWELKHHQCCAARRQL